MLNARGREGPRTRSYARNLAWGFVVYRTTYDDDAAWERAKTRLLRAKDERRESIESEGGDPDLATLVFIENEAELKDKSPTEVRL